MVCYGLSPTFKGSSKGSYAFGTIGHHLSRNTNSGTFFARVVSSYSCIGLCVLALNSFSISEESPCFSFYLTLYILLFFLETSFH
jgi:hypothetical protein